MNAHELPAAGWYPDPTLPTLRWWDGQQWTEQLAPLPAAQAPVPQRIVTRLPRHTNHTFHLIMTVLTLGLWAPIWWLVSVINSARTEKSVSDVR